MTGAPGEQVHTLAILASCPSHFRPLLYSSQEVLLPAAGLVFHVTVDGASESIGAVR